MFFRKASYSTRPSDRVRVRAHVDATGRRRLLSAPNKIAGLISNPSGGMQSAPVTKARICGRST